MSKPLHQRSSAVATMIYPCDLLLFNQASNSATGSGMESPKKVPSGKWARAVRRLRILRRWPSCFRSVGSGLTKCPLRVRLTDGLDRTWEAGFKSRTLYLCGLEQHLTNSSSKPPVVGDGLVVRTNAIQLCAPHAAVTDAGVQKDHRIAAAHDFRSQHGASGCNLTIEAHGSSCRSDCGRTSERAARWAGVPTLLVRQDSLDGQWPSTPARDVSRLLTRSRHAMRALMYI